MGNGHDNLIPLNKRTKEEQRRIAKNGGIKSGKVRKEKKLLSQIYAEILADKNGIDGNGKTLKDVVNEILVGNPLAYPASSKVSMIKEIREATEGSKLTVDNPSIDNLVNNGIKVMFEDSNNESADS